MSPDEIERIENEYDKFLYENLHNLTLSSLDSVLKDEISAMAVNLLSFYVNNKIDSCCGNFIFMGTTI